MRTGCLLITRHHLKFRLQFVFSFVISMRVFLRRPFAPVFRSERERERVLIAITTSMFQQTGHPQIMHTLHTRKVIGDGWNAPAGERRNEEDSPSDFSL